MQHPIRILIAEDLPTDAELAQREIRGAIEGCVFERVETPEDYLAALEAFRPHVVISDYNMPRFDGLTALRLAQQHAPLTPLIIFTGSINEDTAVECMKAGAVDYVLKEQMRRLGQAVVHALEGRQLREDRRRAEEALREIAENMAEAQRIAHFGSWEVRLDPESLFIEPHLWSDECYRIFGLEPGSVTITTEFFLSRVHPDDREALLEATKRGVAEHTGISLVHRIVLPDGAIRYIQEQSRLILDERTGQPLKLIGTAHDITERREAEEAQSRLEAQLRQAQRLESIGRLAGGVAHDFNNLLTVIRGYCEFLLAELPAADPLREDVIQIQQASDRATTLTRQLLAFGRKQILAPTVLDLNALISQIRKMLERVIGEDITLTTTLQPDLWSVTADPGQLEQVLLNLVVNARDAMPTGGRLTIETHNRPAAPDTPEAEPSVLVIVADTGIGMDDHVRAQIFEPFFTTKGPGQGTGLGLATAYGIVTQSGGTISVESAPGKGATFTIALPASESQPRKGERSRHAGTALGGRETILLVEDDGQVRRLARLALQEKGYIVLEARDGPEALALAERHVGPIHLLLTDVVMPQLSGRALAEQLAVRLPRLKVLFTSGYTDDTVIRHGLLSADVTFLAKPFSPSTLAVKVREVLDRPEKVAGGGGAPPTPEED